MNDSKVSTETLKMAQSKMFDILSIVDDICRDNDIQYWLDAGTLLGAHRHQGFIPWDDDIDVAMLRKDYNKFLSVAQTKLPAGMFLQTSKTDKFYFRRSPPCKVRLDGTYILEKWDLDTIQPDAKYHQGLFVDIFPMDFYSKNRFFRAFERSFYKVYCSKMQSFYKKERSVLKAFIVSSIRKIPWSFFEAFKSLGIGLLSKNKKSGVVGFGSEVSLELGYQKQEHLFPLKELIFEGKSFFVPNNTAAWLECRYGNTYMELPPESDRNWHALNIKFDL
jgi:lipopolysaccharide cholinephosphotransferase